jgi:biopolymer transport protein ExbD
MAFEGNSLLSNLMKRSDIILAVFVIGTIGVLVIPVPPGFLDFALAFNITFSLVILLTTLYITRPLELSSRLRETPRNFDWLFLVNVGLLGLFFTLFGSRFVLAPGLGVDFRLPTVAGADAGARPATHVISVINSGQIFTNDGLRKLSELGGWLKLQAEKTERPLLLVRAGADVPTSVLADVASAARGAGFEMIWAAGEPAGAGGRADRFAGGVSADPGRGAVAQGAARGCPRPRPTVAQSDR